MNGRVGGRVGLFGGSFNPVHLAHLRAAEEVREAHHLDEIRFVPAAAPPHKEPGALAPIADRIRMLELALAGCPGLAVSTVEIERGGTSYSIDTIRAVLAEPHAPSSLVFVLGFDAFRDLASWRAYAEIFAACDVIVLPRPGAAMELRLHDFPVASQKLFCYDPLRDNFRHDAGHTVTLARIPPFDISSTEIRSRVNDGRSIRFLVPPAVERHIEARGLYGHHTGGSRRIES